MTIPDGANSEPGTGIGSQQGTGKRGKGAAVAHEHEKPVGWSLLDRVRARGSHPFRDRRSSFNAESRLLAAPPGRERLGPTSLDLGKGQSFPRAKVALA